MLAEIEVDVGLLGDGLLDFGTGISDAPSEGDGEAGAWTVGTSEVGGPDTIS